MSSHLPIEETDIFRRTEELADAVWDAVDGWKPFARDTVGKQLVRSADSIGANLVEGDGRFSDADSIHFFVIARASARETGYWIRRAKCGRLLDASLADDLLNQLEIILRSLNGLINYRRNRGKAVREEVAVYDAQFRAAPPDGYLDTDFADPDYSVPEPGTGPP